MTKADRDRPARSRASEKSLLEDDQEALDEIDRLTESWHQRLSIDNLAFPKRYFENEVGLGIEVRLKKDDSKKFVTFFERDKLPRNGVLPAPSLYGSEVGAYRNNRAVLIDNVELMQAPEQFASSASVWLQESDQFFDRWPGSFEERGRAVVGKAVLRPTYWEVGFTYRRVGVEPSSFDKGCCERIKAGAKIVDDIAHVASPRIRDGLDYVELVNFYSGLRIVIENDLVRLAVLEGCDLNIEVIKVFYGPI